MPTTIRNASESRARILAAATVEFAERGFEGAGVDRIARRARLNKAMIYYHFQNKADLYREILRDMFRAAGDRVRAIADGPAPPDQKIHAFIAAVVAEFQARPHFPTIMLREIAEKGRHFDTDTLLHLQTLPRTFREIVGQGVRAGQFRPVDPMLVYYTVAGPLLFYLASAPLRHQLTKLGTINLQAAGLPDVMAHVAAGAVTALQRESAAAGGGLAGALSAFARSATARPRRSSKSVVGAEAGAISVAAEATAKRGHSSKAAVVRRRKIRKR